MYSRNPVFTLELSPPVQWTYHNETDETHDQLTKRLKETKEKCKHCGH